MFLGQLDAADFCPYPFLDPDSAELLSMVRGSFGRFAEEHIDAESIDRAHAVPEAVLAGLSELGLFGMRIPEEYGGLDLNATQYCRVGMDLSAADGAVAILSGGHSTIGIKALLLAGTEEQKAKYLPRLATGELKAAFALSEPDAGSDAQALTCTAKLSEDKQHYVVNGNKLWITNGGLANLVTLFVRTPDHPRTDGRPSISCLLVEREMGYEAGREETKLGIRGSSTVPLVFEDVSVPVENLVGVPGEGFRLARALVVRPALGKSDLCSILHSLLGKGTKAARQAWLEICAPHCAHERSRPLLRRLFLSLEVSTPPCSPTEQSATSLGEPEHASCASPESSPCLSTQLCLLLSL